MLSGDRKVREFSNLEADNDDECWRNDACLLVRYVFHDRKFHKSEIIFKKTEESHFFFLGFSMFEVNKTWPDLDEGETSDLPQIKKGETLFHFTINFWLCSHAIHLGPILQKVFKVHILGFERVTMEEFNFHGKVGCSRMGRKKF